MKAGDKVVCVDDGPSKIGNPFCDKQHSAPRGWLTKGIVYLVEQARGPELVGGFYFSDSALVVLGKPSLIRGHEVGWSASRFRLLSEVGHPPVAVEQPEPEEVAL